MDPITPGSTGAAVEDIQERLVRLDYVIDDSERKKNTYGPSTAKSVARFRLDHDLSLGEDVDTATWMLLVDESYQLGDRTLYLRLPNFHGNDVRQLQERLNILGFSCGKPDGQYGVHTEAAVKLFQESVGELADGMAFQDTLDAIERLRHVWSGKQAKGPHPQGGMGFARAANVLETIKLAITGEDPIARNVAGRVVNLATATSEASGIELVDSIKTPTHADAILVITSQPAPVKPARGKVVIGSVSMDENETLPIRLRTAFQSAEGSPRIVRVSLPEKASANGSFTLADAQTFAVLVLDAICGAFAAHS